jgi:FkbM family methyltransferase
MLNLLKRQLSGTALDYPARWVHAYLTAHTGALYDVYALELIRRCLRADSACVDVGSHKGSFLRHFARLAPQGSHYAFEPIPHLARQLRQEFGGRPRITVVAAALGSQDGDATFQHVVTNPAYSGLRRRSYAKRDERIEEIKVQVVRLDSARDPHARVDLIKIDVEGGELGVLEGGLETLRRWQPLVIFEHGLGGADHYGTTPMQVHQLLAGACGLEVFPLKGWPRYAETQPLSQDAFCAHFYEARDFYFIAASPSLRATLGR